NMFYNVPTGKNHYFGVNNTQHMSLLASGNLHVGGTADILAKLGVTGGIIVNGGVSDFSGQGVYTDYDGGSSVGRITTGSNGGNNRNLALRSSAGTPNDNQLFLKFD
ncbi:hypothetical protein RZS08_35730, partial [Arthrospira platensis SPKY1]|nr:hypothetical protein [Arthrospira platensis SPKY1]